MSKSKKITDGRKNLTLLQYLGLVLLLLGIVLLLISGLSTLFTPTKDPGYSGLAATGFFNIMLGIAFVFPEMLEGNSGSVSTMRICIFMIISVFVVLVIKIGWATTSLAAFTLDETWAYVIAIALGSKAVQYFGEKLSTTRKNITSNLLSSDHIRQKSADFRTTVLSPSSGTRNVPTTPPSHIVDALKHNK